MKGSLRFVFFVNCGIMIICTARAISISRQIITTSRAATALYSSSTPKYEKSYRLSGVGKGTKVEISTDTGHFLSTDIPKTMGGTDSAPQPVETLLAAWMGCTQATALFVGRQLPDNRVVVELDFENILAFRDERGALQLPITEIPEVPSRLNRITGTIKVSSSKGDPLSTEQMQLLQQQTEIRCPVANMMIASGCSIDVKWINASK